MSTVVDDLIEEVISKEGGYCNDVNDLGGETCWGVTIAEARNSGYTGNMKDFPRSHAVELYREKYWYRVHLDEIADRSIPVARELFDTGINMGVGKAGEFLQQALNAFNNQGKYYADVAEDGDIGPGTLRAFDAFLDKRGTDGLYVLLKALNCLQGARYIDISRKRPQNEDFTYGWIKNRVSL